MFAKPAFGQILAVLLALTATFIVGVAPPDFWWSKIDPLGSSFQRLARAPGFYIGNTDVEGQVSDEVSAWQTLARSPRADSLFRQLLVRGTPAGRLYALVGLSQANPDQFRRLALGLRTDSTLVDFWTPCGHGYLVPLGRLTTDARLTMWADLLRHWDPTSQHPEKACAV